MSGGIAYVFDENHDLYKRMNHELVKMYSLDDETTTLSDITDEENLKNLIQKHTEETASERGKKILSDWDHYKKCFKKIIPDDYLRIITEIKAQEKAGAAHDDAVLAAFKKCSA